MHIEQSIVTLYLLNTNCPHSFYYAFTRHLQLETRYYFLSGLARDCHHLRCWGFPEFDSIHASGFPTGCSKV